MRDRRFGAAGDTVVIEECLAGPEVSFFVLSDGTRAADRLGPGPQRIFDETSGPIRAGWRIRAEPAV
jgi:phosphoribosylamine--glycine ligase